MSDQSSSRIKDLETELAEALQLLDQAGIPRMNGDVAMGLSERIAGVLIQRDEAARRARLMRVTLQDIKRQTQDLKSDLPQVRQDITDLMKARDRALEHVEPLDAEAAAMREVLNLFADDLNWRIEQRKWPEWISVYHPYETARRPLQGNAGKSLLAAVQAADAAMKARLEYAAHQSSCDECAGEENSTRPCKEGSALWRASLEATLAEHQALYAWQDTRKWTAQK